MTRWILAVVCLLSVACGSDTPAARDAAPTRTAVPISTAAPTALIPTPIAPPPTSTVSPTRTAVPISTAAPTAINYTALRTGLLTPLSALIIATRANNTQQMAQHFNNFTVEAEKVLPVIKSDMSTNANRLNSAIVNTRDAYARKDVAALESVRLQLLEVR